MIQALFNKIVIIESLGDGELKTGRKLYDDILMYTKILNIDKSLLVSYYEASAKQEFINLLEMIASDARTQGIYPLLHIECHGDDKGLRLRKEEITWKQLRDSLININEACRLNLAIILAACEGLHLISTANKMDRAPFYFLIAPKNKITFEEAHHNFSAFYRSMFEGLKNEKFDLYEAIKALNNGQVENNIKYFFHGIEMVFQGAIASYLKNHASRAARLERVDTLLTEARKNPSVREIPIKVLRSFFKKGLQDHSHHFEKFKKRYFFIDQYPENKDRFRVSLDDCLIQAKEE